MARAATANVNPRACSRINYCIGNKIPNTVLIKNRVLRYVLVGLAASRIGRATGGGSHSRAGQIQDGYSR